MVDIWLLMVISYNPFSPIRSVVVSPLSFLILIIWVLSHFFSWSVKLEVYQFCWPFQRNNFWFCWFLYRFSILHFICLHFNLYCFFSSVCLNLVFSSFPSFFQVEFIGLRFFFFFLILTFATIHFPLSVPLVESHEFYDVFHFHSSQSIS